MAYFRSLIYCVKKTYCQCYCYLGPSQASAPNCLFDVQTVSARGNNTNYGSDSTFILLVWSYHQQELYQETPRRSPPPPRVCRVVTFSSPASWLWSNGLHMGAFKTISCSFTRPQRTLVSMLVSRSHSSHANHSLVWSRTWRPANGCD